MSEKRITDFMVDHFDFVLQMYNIQVSFLSVVPYCFSLSFSSKFKRLKHIQDFFYSNSIQIMILKNSLPKSWTLFFLLLFGSQVSSFAQDEDPMFTIYLVRHAEKELSADHPKDPPLTPCGEQRAASLEVFLSAVQLDAIYSSDYTRTRHTAKPVAQNRNMETRLYDPKKLEEFAKLLIERGENALVVGHSNSTPVLAGLLVGEKLEPIDESIYNRIYQVVIHKETGRLHVLHSVFDCKE